MTADDTGNGDPLSLPERARRGLLAAEPKLSPDEIAELEHPSDPAPHEALAAAILAAIRYGDLPDLYIQTWIDYSQTGLHRPWEKRAQRSNSLVSHKEPCVERETYRAWRAQCPASLLSPLSQVSRWLDAQPSPPETPTPALPALPKPDLPAKRKRNDALADALRAAIAVLSPDGSPPPSSHALFEYLKTRDTTRTVTGVSRDGKALLWMDSNGNPQKTKMQALSKRISRIRKAG